MPRTADPHSNRQRGFRILDGLRFEKREVAIEILMKELHIAEPYAATIHASHRRLDKQRGILHTLYSVEEYKDGKKVKPYIKKVSAYKATSLLQRMTKQEAIDAWLLDNETRKKQVLTLG